MGHRGLQHRSRIGETRRLENDAAKHDALIVEVAQQRLEGPDQIAAQRAA
jgi:hypothetical protein